MYDLIVFGASGFTGQFVALDVATSWPGIKWALGGRSESKLTKVQEWVQTEVPKAGKIPIVIADENDEASMNNMCKQTKLIMNCTGPYRYYGEPVVRACVANGCHYVDISGEPDFIERMMLQYHEEAKKKGIFVVSACGFDSIPSDMGTVFTTNQFPKEGCASSVEAYLQVDAFRGHYTTYECIVLGVAHAQDLLRLRQQEEKIIVPYVGPKLQRRNFGFHSLLQRYFVPFKGSDGPTVRNSQRYLVQSKSLVTPVQFAVYFTMPSLWNVVGLVLFALVLGALSPFRWGRALLLRYPKVFTLGGFSHEGPSKEERAKASFKFTFLAKGYQNKRDAINARSTHEEGKQPDFQVITTIQGPEPGYIATPICMVESARCILTQLANPNHSPVPGGVLTSASAFRDTNLIQALNQRGISFKVESSGPFSPPSKL